MTQVPPRISALLNQKGGVGKTTSTVNIGAAIASLGRRTLLIDLDPQSHLSLHLGVDGSSAGRTAYDALVEPDIALRDCIMQVRDNLWLLPSTTDLAGAETELASHPDRNRILRERFEVVSDEFDFVLIDCPPSLGVLTLNGLCLADEVVVPMQAQFLAMQGLTKLLETVQLLSQGLNPALRVGGVVLCMHESQTAHSREVVQELSNFFDEHAGSGLPWDGAKVFMPAVRRNIKLAEAPSFGQTIFDYAPWCPGAIDYRALAERFVREWELAHGVADAVAGKPTPAAAAAAAAVAAAAAAAAAAAVQSSRFTPETAAAARAARLAKGTSPRDTKPTVVAASVTRAGRVAAESASAAGTPARNTATSAAASEVSSVPQRTVGARAAKSATKAKAAKKAETAVDVKSNMKSDVRGDVRGDVKGDVKGIASKPISSPTSTETVKVVAAATPVPQSEPDIDPSHPFRAAARSRNS
jgi:chromosome partitioning protein